MLIFSKSEIVLDLNIWPIIFLGILNTALGFLVQSYALKYSLPTRVSLIVTLEAVFAVIGSILIKYWTIKRGWSQTMHPIH